MRTNQETAALAWIGGLGAAAAEDVAARFGCSPRVALAQLRRLARDALVEEVRMLHGQPPLYVATRAGLRAAGLHDLGRCRVSAGAFAHLRACARVAVSLELALPSAVVMGERELRIAEHAAGGPLASAEVGLDRDGRAALHRPDLVLWAAGDVLPVAVEVELAVKAPRRLRTIVRGWARSRLVSRVVYYAGPRAARAIARAVADESAGDRVHLLELEPAGELPPALGAAFVRERGL